MADTVDYKAVLADLKAKRAALDQAISVLEGLSGIVGDGTGIPAILQTEEGTGATIQPDTFVGLNIAEAASKFLRMTGRPAKSTDQVADALRRGGLTVTMASVSAILRRNNNAGDGDVVRVGRGLWGLQEWYPGRPRRNRQGAEDEN